MPIMAVSPKMYGCTSPTDLVSDFTLYSNLKTTGVYIYAEDIRVKSRKAIIHAESEIRKRI